MSNIKQNLLGILESVEKIEFYSSDFNDGEDFYYDSKSFDATMMQFVIIGEMISKLSVDFKQKHNDIPWVKIKDFRNIIAHDYFGIDSDEIWDIIQNKIKPLKNDIINLLNEINK